MSKVFSCGIDLGTTFSCCAFKKDEKVDVAVTSTGRRTVPSYVCFKSDDDIVVGEAAKNNLNRYPNSTVYDVKRLIGKKINDPGVQEDRTHYPFSVVGDENNNAVVSITINGNTTQYTPEKLSSLILEYIRDQAINANSLKKDERIYAVITVPAYFKDSQRRLTMEAGRLAGLNVLRVINEPTAAAIAYGYQYLNDESKKDIKTRILVYDFGGGTFDVSIIEVDKKEINVLATGGDDHLGGEDITNNLVKYYIEKLRDEADVDISNDNRNLIRLKNACEEAKRLLSEMEEADVSVDILEDYDISNSLNRPLFVEINRGVFNKTIDIVRSTLSEGNISKESIKDVVLVGGSSRIPKVKDILSSEFPEAHINIDINPDEAVAVGAAELAADICRGASEKHFDNGCDALVDENGRVLFIISGTPPSLPQSPPPELNDDDDDEYDSDNDNLPVEADFKPEAPSSPHVDDEDESDYEDDSDNANPNPQPSFISPPPQPPPPPPPVAQSNSNDLPLPIDIHTRPEATTSPVETSEEYLPIATELPITQNIVETVPVELPKYINNSKPKSASIKSPSFPKPKKVIKKTPLSTPSPQIKNKKKIRSSSNTSFSSSRNHIQIHDVLSHGICKSTYRNKQKVLETIVRKNTRLPCSDKESRAYHTTRNNQKFIKFGYYESDDCVLERATKIRQCKINNIPPHRVGEVGFVHVLSIDENQIINVRIYEENHKMPDIKMTIVK